MEAKKEERENPHLFLRAKVITDETFSHHEGFDLVSFDWMNSPISNLPTFCIHKKMTYSTFKSRVAQRLGCSECWIRILVLSDRQNRMAQPDTLMGYQPGGASER